MLVSDNRFIIYDIQELLQYAKNKLLQDVKISEDVNWLEMAAQVAFN